MQRTIFLARNNRPSLMASEFIQRNVSSHLSAVKANYAWNFQQYKILCCHGSFQKKRF